MGLSIGGEEGGRSLSRTETNGLPRQGGGVFLIVGAHHGSLRYVWASSLVGKIIASPLGRVSWALMAAWDPESENAPLQDIQDIQAKIRKRHNEHEAIHEETFFYFPLFFSLLFFSSSS